MILDSSVIIAIVCRESGYERLLSRLEEAPVLGIGAPTLAETGIVLESRLGIDGRAILERFLQDFQILTIPFGEIHWREALDAYRRFGKGRHKAALNFGDCMSYATARLSGQELFFVGDDFVHTDLSSETKG